MTTPDRRPLGQLQLKHLLGMLTLAAMLMVLVAPWIRSLQRERQLSVGLKALAVLVAVIGITTFLMIKQRQVALDAGALLARHERLRYRVLSWLIAAALWAGYAASAWEFVPQRPQQFTILPGSPVLLFFAVNYSVIRLWWKLDPTGIEVRQNGLVLGGLQYHPWEAITRYSWSGTPPRQLNLFLRRRMVVNLAIDSVGVERLEPLLAEHLGGNAPRETAAAGNAS